jgi:hypothetical protein
MSEPVHIKEILPAVMAEIRRRMELYHRRKRVLSAVADYYQNRKQGYRRPTRARKRSQSETGRSGVYSGKLFERDSGL